jgi:uncharacterized coiled-coil protein SlyX
MCGGVRCRSSAIFWLCSAALLLLSSSGLSADGQVWHQISEEELTELETILTRQAETIARQEMTLTRLSETIDRQATTISGLATSFLEYESEANQTIATLTRRLLLTRLLALAATTASVLLFLTR